MKATEQKGWLKTGGAIGAIAVHDGHSGKPAPQMDYADLALPPYMRCASTKCANAFNCQNPARCFARAEAGTLANGQTFSR